MSTSAGRALELADLARRLPSADEVEALVHVERSGLARFAASRVHQPTLIDNESVMLRVVRDGRIGTATTNRTDEEGLTAAARRAEEAADAAPPDPGFPGLPPPVAPIAVDGWDAETAALAPEAQADRAWKAIAAAAGIDLYGYFTSAEVELAVASSTGLAVSQRMTDAAVLAIAADADRSGYAAASAWRVAELDEGDVARRAVEIARRTSAAAGLEPGTHRAVLCPDAFADLLASFAHTSVGALALLEERSYLAGRIGEQAFHPSFTLVDDGHDPAGLPKAFDLEGVPKEVVAIIEEGIVRDVVWDRRTAAAAGNGRHSTGHAVTAPDQGIGPVALNLVVHPGQMTVDELIERVGEGILVTRLHYLSVVDPREGVITGTTKDGTFRIRDGRLAEPLVNLRFTTSFPAVVRDLVGLSREVSRVAATEFYDARYPTASVVPTVATASFQIVGTGAGPGL